jgi:hypothetical protein
LTAQKTDELKAELEKIAKDQKLAEVPLTIAVDGEAGPEAYSLNKDVPVTVVVYDKTKKIVNSFSFDKIDIKAEKDVFADFAKVLGVDPPKLEDDKKDEKK